MLNDTFDDAPSTNVDGDIRVGDVVTYELRLGLNNGSTDSVSIVDTLPAGMELVDIVSINGNAAAPYTDTIFTSLAPVVLPTATSTGALTFNLGDIVNDVSANASATDDLVIVYRARVLSDTLAFASSTTLSNNAVLSYDTVAGSSNLNASSDVVVQQPLLATTKDVVGSFAAGDTVTAGDVVSYEITVTNSGDAPAYDVQVLDTVPFGLRAGGVPVIADVTIDVNGAVAAAGSVAPSAVVTFTTDGQLLWDFDSGTANDYTIEAGQSLVLTYNLTVDSDVAPNQTLTNDAQVGDYFSFDDDDIPDGGGLDARESFGPSAAVGVDVVTPGPGDLAKTVDVNSAVVGELVTYTLTVPATAIGSQLFDVEVTDQLPPNVSFVSAAYGTGNDAGVIETLTTAVDASNVLTISTGVGGFDIPADESAVIDVVVRVNNTATENIADSFHNQANYSYETEDGGTTNIVGGADIQAPAVTIHESLITGFAKAGRNVTQGDPTDFSVLTAPNAGDVLEYQLTFTADAGVNAADVFDLTIVDTLGASLSYQAGSSVVAGSVVGVAADNAIADPSIAGTVLTWGLAASDIDIAIGETVLVRYQVLVDSTATGGQTLTNNVVVQWSSLDGVDPNERTGADGEGGAVNDYAIDTPATVSTIVEDNTDFEKTIVSDSFGTGAESSDGITRVGDTIDYALTLSLNNGTTDNILVADTLPVGLEFVSTVSINGDTTAPYATTGLFTFNAVSSPAVGDTVLNWNIGTVVNDVSTNAEFIDDFVIIYRARVMDETLATAASTVLTNEASLNYDSALGAALQQDSSVDMTVQQPILAIDKVVLPVAGSEINANDVIQYTLSVTNSGDAPAYDIRINDVVPAGMRANGVPQVSDVAIMIEGNVVAPIAPLALGVFADDGIIQWNLDDGTTADTYTLNVGETLTITYDLTVDADVGPGLVLTNLANIDSYFSLDDDDLPVDVNVDDIEQFDASDNTSVDLVTPSPGLMSKEASPLAAAVGDLVTYTFTVPETPISAALFDVDIADQLPSGVRCVTTPNVCNVRYATDNAATGILQSSIDADNVLSITTADGGVDIPANEQALISIDVIVTDTVAEADQVGLVGTEFINEATYTYEQADEGTANLSGGLAAQAAVTVEEPEIVVSKDGSATIDLDGSSAATFDAWAQNTGDTPAHNTVLLTVLAEELRETPPANIVLAVFDAVNGNALRPLVDATDFITSYDSNTGELRIELLDTALTVLAVGEVLNLQYEASLNDALANDLSDLNGLNIVNRTVATNWRSGAASNTDARDYARIFGVGTDDDADDAQASHALAINAPVLNLIKRVDNVTNAQSTPNADPGDLLQFSIDIINTGSIAGIVDFTDDIEALNASTVFVPGTLTNVQVSPAATPTAPVNVSIITGGVRGTGLVAFDGIEIDAGQTRRVSFQVRIAQAIPDGTFAFNQAEITADYLTDPLLSDSNLAADDDEVNQGNGPSLTDDDPVVIRLPARPGLLISKRDIDVNGDTLEAGETLRYEIIVDNVGVDDAINVIVTDTIPANTTYVAGSTTLNGVSLADVGGLSPVVSGLAVNSDDTSTLGVISGGTGNDTNLATVQFDVIINDNLLPGTLISNQAIVAAEGANGPLPVTLSDDPDTADVTGDPTRSIVGNSPYLDATKIVGAVRPVLDDSLLTYSFIINNLGNQSATGVTLTDAVPANTTYVANSTLLNGVALADQADGTMPLAAPGGIELMSVGAAQGEIPPDGSVLVTFQVTIDEGTSDGTVITNQGTVSSNELPDEPTDSDSNDDNGDQPTQIAVGDVPSIQVNKQVLDMNGGTVLASDVLQYVVTVTNIGSLAASDVTITDELGVLPVDYVNGSALLEGFSFTDSAADADGGSFDAVTEQLTAQIPSLISGATATLRFSAIVDDIPNGTVINNEVVATDSQGNTSESNASVSVGAATSSASLSGNVWMDPNHNDIIDSDEELQSGWLVQLLSNGNLIAESITDADGSYEFNGLIPGPGYELRFSLNGNTGSAGETASDQFTTFGQTIQSITLDAGDNLLDQSLPIDPSGVIYDSVRRVPVPDVTVTLFFDDGAGRREVPDTCVAPGQQRQVTIDNGFYAFDINVGFPGCPGDNTIYDIEFVAPDNFFIPGISTIIPPEEGALDAGLCTNGAGGDSIPSTVDCELTPSNELPAEGQPTVYFLSFDIESGDSEVFNNHIPVDPILEGAVVLRKTTPKVNASRGELVPYTITVSLATAAPFDALTGLQGLEVRDILPPGFKFVEGSSRVNGVDQAPAQSDGRNFVWNDLTVERNQPIELQMVLIVGAGVTEGEYINIAQAFNSDADVAVSNQDEATVRVVPDPTFDCTDIIGKVYDDANVNGYQDRGEEALPAVRLATARGLLVTTDEHGRYHITCAVVPNEERGSNFIIKLDESSLPSGYRVTTENPRVIRATRGKLAKANFGAAIHRVVRLDLMNGAFDSQSSELKTEWDSHLDSLVSRLRKSPSILRLVYMGDTEKEKLVRSRLRYVEKAIKKRWKALNCCYSLEFEKEVYWRNGVPGKTPRPKKRKGEGK